MRRGRDVLADEIGADGKLAVPSVDEDCKLHAGGATEIAQRIERRADGAAGEQDVVDKHDGQSVDIEADVGRVDLGGKMRREIIAIEADVERAKRYIGALDLLDLARKAMSEQVASRIWCAMRVSDRSISSASIQTDFTVLVSVISTLFQSGMQADRSVLR